MDNVDKSLMTILRSKTFAQINNPKAYNAVQPIFINLVDIFIIYACGSPFLIAVSKLFLRALIFLAMHF